VSVGQYAVPQAAAGQRDRGSLLGRGQAPRTAATAAL